MRQVIHSSFAPEAIGPYSQAIETDQFIFTSGQIPINPKTGKIEGATIEAQAEQVMQNIKSILAECGIGMDRIVKTTCFLADLADFAAFNEVYGKYFPEAAPARSCFQVAALPMGAKLEVECIAAK